MTASEVQVIVEARRWAVVARTFDLKPDSAAAYLLRAVTALEESERREARLMFLGEEVAVGGPVTQNLYDYLKAQVPKVPSWWSIR